MGFLAILALVILMTILLFIECGVHQFPHCVSGELEQFQLFLMTSSNFGITRRFPFRIISMTSIPRLYDPFFLF